ncbi:sugar phosphate isomerase/epimerase family protein [Niveispirillum sp. KHB5.9]|uniref:sugar phosphate isomerase/epimerase family protein n=1 Tax=Niveispirillum sp. KHB5.9 TaxID=3400269 RepID=UPI003A84C661
MRGNWMRGMAGALALLLGTATGAWGGANPPVPDANIAVQLFSLHKDLARDAAGTLKALRASGVTQVEAFNTLGRSPADFKVLLDQAGLTASGTHVSLKDLRENVPGIIETAKIVGYRYVGVAWLKPQGAAANQGIGPAEVDATIAAYKAACPALKAAGLRVMYHLHGYEFAADGKGTLLDRLLAGLDPACVELQMDVFWVLKAGVDPVALLDRLGGRVKLLHVKDMAPGASSGEFTGSAKPGDFAPIGSGSVDWTALLAAARKAGVDWYVLEDESPTPMAHLATSLAWLQGK